MIMPLNPSFVRNSVKRISTLGKYQLFPLACTYHATIDMGVAATKSPEDLIDRSTTTEEMKRARIRWSPRRILLQGVRPDELSTKYTSFEKVSVRLSTYKLKPQYGGLLTFLEVVSSVAYCFTGYAWELAHVHTV